MEEPTKLVHKAVVHATHLKREQDKMTRTVKAKEVTQLTRIRTSILTGAFGGRASTLGTTEIRIADKMQPSWVFHIVSQEIKIQGDGILGRDNMWNKCIINTIDKTLNIFDKEHSMKTFTLYTSEECEKVDTQKVCLTKRAVTIVPVNIITKEKTVVVHKQEIFPGVYVGNTVVDTQNRITAVPILNSTENDISLNEEIKVKFSNFNHYTHCDNMQKPTLQG
ncbi:hypothetical protein EVAR_102528_1 [Eumeta japonica]|uniref:Uncharacterized protein n=1 Tax=Eumeta variegata TaxID=151549 RepID=A0A4C1SIS3_EUMVA|nr:hypothetical protein EVAR_102528_1 [Eumeta japonica]